MIIIYSFSLNAEAGAKVRFIIEKKTL